MLIDGDEDDSPSTWRFSLELLSHVHTLRVFLFPSSPQLHPARDCANLEATLVPAPPTLSCSWNTHHHQAAAPHSLLLPLPLLLFDYSSCPRISTFANCIQLSLSLLPLPSIHLHALSSLSPSGAEPADIISWAAHAAVDTDFTVLADMEGAHSEKDDIAHRIHDKSGTHESLQSATSAENGIPCQPSNSLRHEHVHMSSADICTYADVTSEVEDTHDAKQYACCVQDGNYNCIVDLNYANSDISDDDTHRSPEGNCALRETGADAILMPNKQICDDNRSSLRESLLFQCHNHKGGAVEVSEGSFLCQHNRVANTGSSACNQSDEDANHILSVHQGSDDHPSQGIANFACKNCLTKVTRKPVRSFMQLPCFDWREVVENWFGACCCSFGSAAEVLSVSFERSLQLRPGKCLVGPSTFYLHFSDVSVITELGSLGNEANIRQVPTPSFLALGNGFMVWENQHSKKYKWLPIYCTSCGSLIGAYPGGLSREGLHLFRCQIMTYKTDGAPYHAYRCETFKDLLVKELKQRTDENTCHRFLIRSLSSEQLLLQLVVLNYDSLTCTGRVNAALAEPSQRISENANEVGLQQSMKVLFLDCTRFSEYDVRSAELWAKEYDAESVFMLEEFVLKVRDELLTNSVFCPAECGLFQSFMGSFLYTT